MKRRNKSITEIEYLEEYDVLSKGAIKSCYPLTMWYTLGASELHVFLEKLKYSHAIKASQEIIINKSQWFYNVWILLYWIYWFYAKR